MLTDEGFIYCVLCLGMPEFVVVAPGVFGFALLYCFRTFYCCSFAYWLFSEGLGRQSWLSSPLCKVDPGWIGGTCCIFACFDGL